jgi:hypothetical protein
MAPKNSHIEQVTIRFDRTVPEQARALAIYEELLKNHQHAKALGTLFPVVLTVLADVAKDHPALNNQQARLVAKYQDQVMALIARLEAGESVPELDTPPPPRPKAQPAAKSAANPAPAGGGDIEIDFDELN